MALLLHAEGEVLLESGPRHLELLIHEPRGNERLRGKLVMRVSRPVAGVVPFADDSLTFNGTLNGLGKERAITFSSCVQEGGALSYFDMLVLQRARPGDDQLRGRFLRPPQAQRLAALYKRQDTQGSEALIHPQLANVIRAEIRQIEEKAATVTLRVTLGAACLDPNWRLGDSRTERTQQSPDHERPAKQYRLV